MGRILLIYSKKFRREVYGLVLYDYTQYGQIRCIIAEKNQNKIEYETSMGKVNKIAFMNEGTFNGKRFQYFEISYDDIPKIVIEVCEYNINVNDKTLYYDNDGFCFIVKLLL